MSARASGKVEKPAKLDRWGLVPVRRGFLRGRAKNVRYSEGISPYGQSILLDFEIQGEDGLPDVPVRMSGTEFWGRVVEMDLVDVADPDPSVRPILSSEIFDNGNMKVIAQYPGRKFLKLPQGNSWQLLFIILPLLGISVFGGVILTIIGVLR